MVLQDTILYREYIILLIAIRTVIIAPNWKTASKLRSNLTETGETTLKCNKDPNTSKGNESTPSG